MMAFESFIAKRYLFSRRKYGFISAISIFSIVGIALGVAALIVVMGVMNGFSENLQDKILGVNAHLVITRIDGPISDYNQVVRRISRLKSVKGAIPFVYAEVMVSSPYGVKGVVLRGIDPTLASKVLSLGRDIRKGSLFALRDHEEGVPGIIVGKDLAIRLGLSVGSFLNVLSPSGQASSFGFRPKIMVFQVVGIFDTGMYEYDSSLVYTTIGAAQRLLGFKKDVVSGIEVKLKDVYAAKKVALRIRGLLHDQYFYIQTWMDMNKSLFSALKLEKIAMGIILTMIVLVGSFSIIIMLFMLVMEKRQDIAILMSMGARPFEIRRIFLYLGSLIGFIGTVAGYIVGLSVGYLLQRYQFIKLPPDVYYLDYLPVKYHATDLILIAVITMTLCVVASLYPASQAAKLEPAQVLRYE